MPPVHMKGDGRKAKNPKKTLTRLLSYMKPYWGRMIAMILCIVVATLASVASNKSLSYLIDDILSQCDTINHSFNSRRT